MVRDLMYTEPWNEILDNLSSSWPLYHPECGQIIGADLIRRERRAHCEIVEICLTASSGKTNLIAKRLLDSKQSTPALISKAQQELSNILSYGALLCGSPFQALEAIGDFTRYHTVITRKGDGRSLKDLIKKHARIGTTSSRMAALEALCEEAGRWLSWIHHRSRKAVQLADHADALIHGLHAKLEQGIGLGLDATFMNPLLKMAKGLLTTYGHEGFPVVMTHNDFTPENLLVNDNGILVLDYQAVDMAGTAYSDVALFTTYLETFAKYPLFGARQLTLLKQAFLRGYDAHWLRPEVLRVYQLKAMLVFFAYMSPSNTRSGLLQHLRSSYYRRWLQSWITSELNAFSGAGS